MVAGEMEEEYLPASLLCLDGELDLDLLFLCMDVSDATME